MKFKELQQKTVSDLYSSLAELKKESLMFRIQAKMGQLSNTTQIRERRRSVAKIMTRLQQLKNK